MMKEKNQVKKDQNSCQKLSGSFLYLALQEDIKEKHGQKNDDLFEESGILAPARMHVFTNQPEIENMLKEEVRLEEMLLETALAFSYTGLYKSRNHEDVWNDFLYTCSLNLDKTGLLRSHTVPDIREVRRVLSFLNPDTVRLAMPDIFSDYLKGFQKSPELSRRDYRNILSWNAFVHTNPVEADVSVRFVRMNASELPDLKYLSDDVFFETPRQSAANVSGFDPDDERMDDIYDILFQYSDLSYLIVPVPKDKKPWEVFLDILPMLNLKGIEVTLPASFCKEEVLQYLKKQKISCWVMLDETQSGQASFSRSANRKNPNKELISLSEYDWLQSYGTLMNVPESHKQEMDTNNQNLFLKGMKSQDQLAPVCRIAMIEDSYESAPFGYTEEEFFLSDPCFDEIIKQFHHVSRCMSAVAQTIKNPGIREEEMEFFYIHPLKKLKIIHDYYKADEVRDMAYRYLSNQEKLRKRSKTL